MLHNRILLAIAGFAAGTDEPRAVLRRVAVTGTHAAATNGNILAQADTGVETDGEPLSGALITDTPATVLYTTDQLTAAFRAAPKRPHHPATGMIDLGLTPDGLPAAVCRPDTGQPPTVFPAAADDTMYPNIAQVIPPYDPAETLAAVSAGNLRRLADAAKSAGATAVTFSVPVPDNVCGFVTTAIRFHIPGDIPISGVVMPYLPSTNPFTPDGTTPPRPRPHVRIEVRGGVADVTECDPSVDVEIIDHDNEARE